MHLTTKGKGFTLLELLVVVVILVVLVGISFPLYHKFMATTKKTQAAVMVNNLKIALNAYHADYGAWPNFMCQNGQQSVVTSYDGDGKILYQLLIGNPDTQDKGNAVNPRGTVYMEFAAKDLCNENGGAIAGGMVNAAGFKDPWGHKYFILVDANYDGQVAGVPDTDPSKAGGATTTINASIAIWSQGDQPPTNDGLGGDQSHYITSW